MDSSLDANDVVDITVTKAFEISDGKLRSFPDREQRVWMNVLRWRRRVRVFRACSTPTLPFYDDMGRFFTLGARVKF